MRFRPADTARTANKDRRRRLGSTQFLVPAVHGDLCQPTYHTDPSQAGEYDDPDVVTPYYVETIDLGRNEPSERKLELCTQQ